MTKNELAQLVLKSEELRRIDYALPDDFVEDCRNLDIDPRPFFVWCYFDSIGGYPINLTERFYLIYQNAQKLWDEAQSMIIDTKDRGEHLDNKGKMHDDFERVCHALDTITLDKREVLYDRLKLQ